MDFNVAKDCKNTKHIDGKFSEFEEGENNTENRPCDVISNTESDFFDENDPDSFKMLTKTAGTLAFAAPERLEDSCYYT